MAKDLALLLEPREDPTNVGFPPTLPLELAAKVASVKTICETYGITRQRYDELRANPVFQRACEEAARVVGEEGGSFKGKIRTMAEALLPRMWALGTSSDFDSVPASVQADMIKTAIRVAGLDASIEQKAKATTGNGPGVAAQINIHLGD